MSRSFILDGDRFECECGKVFSKSQSLYSHMSHCKIHMGDREIVDRFGDSRAWSRGRTKNDPIYGDSIKRISEFSSIRTKNLGDNNPLVIWNKNKPKESYIRQSKTRKEKFSTGELTPALGVGRGKYSYIKYSNKKIMLRSTYEFIYALYLLYYNIEFEVETIRPFYKGKTYISDFLINDLVVEIKGDYKFDYKLSKEAFESMGYRYRIKFWEDLIPNYEFLKLKLNIDDILEKIRIGHDTKKYYIHEFNNNDSIR